MSSLYDDPPHRVDIYLSLPPTKDGGGGEKINYPVTPSQADVPCLINTEGASTVMRQGQGSITVNNRIAFLSEAITIAIRQGAKLVAKDTGRTFIVRGLTHPNRSPENTVTAIPPLTYITADEIL